VVLSAVILALEFVVDLPRFKPLYIVGLVLHGLVAVSTVLLVGVSLVLSGGVRRFVRERWGDLLVGGFVVGCVATSLLRVAGAIAALRNLWRFIAYMTARFVERKVTPYVFAKPTALLTLSFALTIVAGTLALMVPAATVDGKGASFLNALFTSTSAVCVTGLTVVDTGSYFSRFGQWVILVLIQVGGLGIMTITSTLAMALTGRLSARVGRAMQELVEEPTLLGFRRTLYGIVAMTLVFEALGALSLWSSMRVGPSGMPLAPGDRLFYAAFHSVSAFCNAGFGLYPDSLARFAGSVSVNATICTLIIVGGLGFPVVAELFKPGSWRRGPRRFLRALSVHARLTLVTTAFLIVGGAVLYLLFEWSRSLAPLRAPVKMLAAVFQSVTFRTAGFSTVDMSQLGPATLMVGMALMFIGGSPSSTAGGIKTTTFAVLLLAVRAMLLGRVDVEVYGRTVSKKDVYRAVGVATMSASVLFVMCLFLLMAEGDKPFGGLLFEAVSAFGTVGLSTGITPKLGALGKILIIVLMFIGRVGPFSIALLVSSSRQGVYTYPQGKVVVG